MVNPLPLLRLRSLRPVRGGLLSADHHSQRISSSGFEFDSLRMYEQGDDVRRIDWNSSVRVGSIMVRTFREQHNRTIILVLDVSSSLYAGSHEYLKCHIMQIIAHSIGFAAVASRDAVGLCLTNNDRVVEYIAPRAGKSHVMHCMEKIDEAIAHLARGAHGYDKAMQVVFPRNSWVIYLTDGIVEQYESWWKTLASRSFLTIVRIRDRYEKHVPSFCSVTCYDPENVRAKLHRLLGYNVQDHVTAWYAKQGVYARKLGLSLVDIIAGEPYEHIVRDFFERGREQSHADSTTL